MTMRSWSWIIIGFVLLVVVWLQDIEIKKNWLVIIAWVGVTAILTGLDEIVKQLKSNGEQPLEEQIRIRQGLEDLNYKMKQLLDILKKE